MGRDGFICPVQIDGGYYILHTLIRGLLVAIPNRSSRSRRAREHAEQNPCCPRPPLLLVDLLFNTGIACSRTREENDVGCTLSRPSSPLATIPRHISTPLYPHGGTDYCCAWATTMTLQQPKASFPPRCPAQHIAVHRLADPSFNLQSPPRAFPNQLKPPPASSPPAAAPEAFLPLLAVSPLLPLLVVA